MRRLLESEDIEVEIEGDDELSNQPINDPDD